MKSGFFPKAYLVGAVSLAISGFAQADDDVSTLNAVKLSTFGDRLLVNAIYTETYTDPSTNQPVSMEFVEAALLAKSTALPVECDVQSAFPIAETHVDNPSSELVGDWSGDVYLAFDDFDEEEMDEEEDGDGDGDGDGDDTESESEDETETDSEDETDTDSDEESDDESDTESDDETDDTDEMDDMEIEDAGNYQAFLTVSPSGYLVQSESETENDVTTCEVTFIGELSGDVYTKN